MAHMQLSKLILLVLSINVFQKSLETHDLVLPWKWRSGTHQKEMKIGAKKGGKYIFSIWVIIFCSVAPTIK